MSTDSPSPTPEPWDDQQLAQYDDALLDGVEGSSLREPAPNEPKVRRRLDLMRRLHSLGGRDSGATQLHPSDTHTDELPELGGELPERIGRFEIRGQLGQGGFGIVFLAYDESLHREVALKVPRLGTLASSTARERFVREAWAAAALDHQNIVPVFEVGTDGPSCYIVSAVCHGPNLSEWLRDQSEPVASRLAAEIVMTLARAVHHAHGRGVVHRDLKPNNVLLEPCDENDALGPSGSFRYSPKLTDLGLAKLESGDAHETASHMLMGTASYMAPEQAAGKTGHAWSSCDIYALGVMLYELLVGRPPLVGESDIETLQMVQIAEPLGPRRIRPGISRDLDTICLKCLEKDPARRYATAEQLAADLERLLDEKPILARRTTRLEHAWRWCRRNRFSAALLVTIVGVTIGGFTAVAWQWARAERARRETEEQRVQAVWSSRQARRAVDELLTAIGADQLEDEPQFEQVRRVLLEKAVAFYESFLSENMGAGPEVAYELALAQLRLGTMYRWLDQDLEALDALDGARHALESLRENEPANADFTRGLAEVHQHRGHLHFRTQQLADSEKEFGRAVALLESLPEDHKTTAVTASLAFVHAQRGKILEALGRSDEARIHLAQSIGPYRLIVEEEPSIQYRDDLARLLQWAGNLESPGRQEPLLTEALDIMSKLAKEESAPKYRLRVAELQNDLGGSLWHTNQKDDAEIRYRDSIREYESLIKDFPSVGLYRQSLATSLNNLAFLMAEAERFDEADQLLDRGIALMEALVAESGHVSDYMEALAEAYNHQGIRFLRQEEVERAREPLTKCTEAYRALCSAFPDVPRYRHELAGSLHNSAYAHTLQKEFDVALPILEEARDLQLEYLSQEPDSIVAREYLRNHYRILGRCLHKTNRNQEAQANFDEAVRLAFQLHTENAGIDRYRMSVNSVSMEQAIILLTTKDPEVFDPARAVELLQGPTQRSPNFRNYWSWLALAQYRDGSWDSAMESVERSLDLATDVDHPAMIFLIKSMVLVERGEIAAAREAFDQATTHIDGTGDDYFNSLVEEARAKVLEHQN